MNDINKFSEYVGEMALKSMLYEVSATPKPGLVDRSNSGAHKDMDFFTFIDSSSALGQAFYKCALKGSQFNGNNYQELLSDIRPIGIEGEKKMFTATNGINTHKGLVFSLGIISAAAGSIYKKSKNKDIPSTLLCNRVREMTKDISKKEFKIVYEKDKLTYGEKLYLKYGVRGIRGEVESGFSTVNNFSLPIFKKLMNEGNYHINNILVQTLLYLMKETEDSNILGRHDIDILNYVKNEANKAMLLGGIFTKEGKKYIEKMDKDFIQKNISPGGSADLLAVTIMLYLLENPKMC